MVALFDTAGRVDLELERFEYTPAGDTISLIRVDARWVLAPGVVAPRPELVLQRGSRRDRYVPLPGAEDWRAQDGRLWSAGYAVPADIVMDARVRFWLEAEGPRYPLPRPEERQERQPQRPPTASRGNRPHTLLAAGLAAIAALAPAAHPSRAAAQEPMPEPTTAPEATPDATAATPTPDPAAPAAQPVVPPASPAAESAPSATTPVAPAAVPTNQLPTTDVAAAPPEPAADADETADAAIVVVDEPEADDQPKGDGDKKRRRGKRKGNKKAKHERRHRKPRQRKQVAAEPKPKAARPRRRVVAPARQVTPTTTSAPPAPHVTDVPSPLLEQYAIPPYLLPVYQAAAAEYDVPWEVLAAINHVETGFGRNLNVSSAGAQGWMQFMPSTWKGYGVDANLDGDKDPNNASDAIFAAARYLRAAGAGDSLRKAIFAYNHADWYVDMVLDKARALRAMPDEVVTSLDALAQARFPIPGPQVSYSTPERDAANPVAGRRDIRIHADAGRRVVASANGRIVSVGHSRLGYWLILEDDAGNRFTYGHLAALNRVIPGLRRRKESAARIARDLGLSTPEHWRNASYEPAPRVAHRTFPAGKERLFAHPARSVEASRAARTQVDAAPHSVIAQAAAELGVKPSEVVLHELRRGARVTAGTTLGVLGGPATTHAGAHLLFAVRSAAAPATDPTLLLDGWRARERSASLRPKASTATKKRLSLGRTLLLPTSTLAKVVLDDDRLDIYAEGRREIRAGQVDRRVLTSLERLADDGLHPGVSNLKRTPKGRTLMTVAALKREPVADVATDAKAAVRSLRDLPEAIRPAKPARAKKGARASMASATAADRLTFSFDRGAAALSADLKHAPAPVKAIATAANQIRGLPYIWGGGHGSWIDAGYDCSGSVSYALHAAGVLDAPMTSGQLMSWGEAGEGRWITIYANPGHTFMRIGDRFYGTSGFAHPGTDGPDWFVVNPSPEYLAGFVVRHPEGF